MKNIKRILNLILLIFVVLSIFIGNKALAIIDQGELKATSISSAVKKDVTTLVFEDGQNLHYEDLVSEYPLFCRDKGTLVSYNDVLEFTTVDGKLFTVEYEYNSGSVSAELNESDTYEIETTDPDTTEYTYETKYATYVKSGPVQTADPKEAYVLAEMLENTESNRAKILKVATMDSNSTWGVEFLEDTEYLIEQGNIEISDGVWGTIYLETIMGKYYYKKSDGKYYEVTLETASAATRWASYVQWGWWHTDHGGVVGNALSENFFSMEANTFSSYIDSIAKKDGSGNYNYNTEYIVKEGGKEYSVYGPEIDYSPKWVDLSADPTVQFDSDSKTYKIGPFAIDYQKCIIEETADARGAVFARLKECDIITNRSVDYVLNDDTTLEENEFQFIYSIDKPKNEVPDPNEVFYIEINYHKDLTEVQNIHFDFEYMNAGGKFQQIEGTDYIVTWEMLSSVKEEIDDDGDGTADRFKIERKIVKSGTRAEIIQDFTYGMVAARWYEQTSLDSNKNIQVPQTKSGDLKIVKKIEDEAGNAIQVDEDKIFKFKVTTIRANEDGEYKNTSGGYWDALEQTVSVKVEKGSSTGSKILPIETWKDGCAPLYIVEELEAATVIIEGYDYATTKIENGTGEYKENSTDSQKNYAGAVVTATNIYSDQKYKKGRLEIIKEIVDSSGNSVELLEEKVFEFKVTLNINGELIEETVKIPVSKGSSEAKWLSSEYTWKDEAGSYARYRIEENPISGYSVSGPIEGDLVDNDIKSVTVKNTEKMYKGKIQILKQLKNKDGSVYTATKDETFSFEIYIDGKYDRDVTVTVPSGSSQKLSDEIEYEWPVGEAAPICKVIEKKHETFSFSSIDYEEIQLQNNQTKKFTVINKKMDTVGKQGCLQIEKTLYEEAKSNEKFEFEVIINDRSEKVYVEILKGNKTGIWKSEPYKWAATESAPEYKVRESAKPLNYEFVKLSDGDEVKTNQKEFVEGSLQNASTIEIKAENKLKDDNHEGQIEIVKTLTGENGVWVADDDYTFKFKIEVEGYPVKEKTIEIFKGQSQASVMSDDVYSWTGESAPKYTVTEIYNSDFKETLSNATGYLKDGAVENVKVAAVNKCTKEYSAEIKLFKKCIGEKPESINEGGNKPFNFRVYVTENSGKEDRYDVKIEIPEGQDYKEEFVKDSSNVKKIFTWKAGENPPTYRVEEQTPTGEWKELAIENDNNYLKPGEAGTVGLTVVNCYNTDDTVEIKHKGELQIAKILKDSTGKILTTGEDFEIEVKVHNVIINSETGDEGTWDNGGKNIFIKAGDSWAEEFIWKDGKTPKYEVREVNATGYNTTYEHKFQKTNYSSLNGTGTEEVDNTNQELKANSPVLANVINVIDYDKSAEIQIHKNIIIEDKISTTELENTSFRFKVTVYYDNPNEYFTYNGEAYNKKEIFREINADEIDLIDGTTISDAIEIGFKDSDNGPKFIVEEIECPAGWKLESAENTEGQLKAGNPPEKVSFTNRLPGPPRIYLLKIQLGGIVWNDTDYSNGKPSESGYDGIRNEDEAGIGNVKVEIFERRSGSSDTLFMVLYTDCNGRWQVPTMQIPFEGYKDNALKYFVTYTYDGQTYEATTELMTTEKDALGKYIKGTAAGFMGATNADRIKYLKGSMAIERDRNDFNKDFEKIEGGNPIDDNGNTKGSTNKGLELNYTSKDIEYNGYTKKESRLVTKKSDGTAKYGIEASTAELGLYYPFDSDITLESIDTTVDEFDGSVTHTYNYSAIYPYLNNINLGLLERPAADIAIEKDLEEAIVVVNGKIYKYKYGEIANTQFAEYPDLLYKQIQVNQKNINYTLNLYKSDYYYRASVYNTSAGNLESGDNIGNMLNTYLTSIGTTGLESLNLDVYLTYKISVTNESDVYDVKVNKISDYVDSSLQLVTADEIKYIDNIDGTPAGAVVVADEPTKWTWSISGHTEDAGWGSLPVTEDIEDNTSGWRADLTEKVKYDRYETGNISRKEIQSGETVSSKLTFKVNKDFDTMINPETGSVTGIDNCIQLGDKYNIVEIDSYSTYYANTDENRTRRIVGEVAGRVDEDSAPGNIAIEEKLPESHSKNSINWYEDDTDRSPLLKIGLYEEVRNINGIAWEDLETNTIEYSQVVGNGLYDEASEELIPNMTTTLVEKVTIDGIDYDFIWPTEENMTDLNSRTVENLTTFDSTTVTGDTGDELGKYIFTGIPAGDYVVRFTYGDENTLDINNDDVINDDDKDDNGNVKYSGQDYKSTTYQAGNIVENDNYKSKESTPDPTDYEEGQDGYIDNEWHDLESGSAEDLAEARVSDARDDESRRLEVIAKSQNMFYENTSIMDTGTNSYNDSDVDPYNIDVNSEDDKYYSDDALETYYMISNTAKLNMNIESVLNSKEGIVDLKTAKGFFSINDGHKVGGVEVHVLNTNRKLSNDDSINVKFITYDVNNIDFGVETRSKNNIKLDKQIEQITLKTSAGDVLIDAIYDIQYEHDDPTRVGELRVEENATRNPILDANGEYILKPLITLKSESVGTENLQALNKTTRDLGFRYLNVDKDLLQGATITIKYRITALNTGEVDRCNKALIDLGDLVNSFTHSSYTALEDLLRDLRDEEADATTGYVYGQYLGQIYYQGATITSSTLDAVVTSKVKQVIDYVDNDVVFSQEENVDKDASWANTTTAELEENRYIDNVDSITVGTETIDHIIEETLEDGTTVRKIVDSRGVAYESEAKNNLIVSVENITGDTLANPELIKPLTPYDSLGYDADSDGTAENINSSYINVTVSRYYSSDMDIEEVENIAETLKLYNDVGRRDLETIQGNVKPALGAMELLSEELDEHGDPIPKPYYENDTAVTELITLSPPTGTVITTMLLVQVMAVVLVGITILAGGIALIKRKVIIK